MKIHTWYISIQYWLIRFVQMQLFISLVSLPILIAWGLPLSIVSPIANLIFSPIFTLFLLFSSLLFFTELLYIPNTWLAWCLEQITNFWFYILSWQHNEWLYGFIKPSPWFLCMIPACTFIIVYTRETKKPVRTIGAFSLLFFGIALASHISSKQNTIHHIPFGNKHVTLIHAHNQNVLIDTGTIASRASAPSWINYTLIPYILQTTGSLQLDHIIITKPSTRIFEALTILCTKIKIKNIYLPYWKGTLPKNTWRNYFKMKKILQEKNGNLIRISSHGIMLPLHKKSLLIITPLEKQVTYHNATFAALEIQRIIEEKKTDIN